MAAWDNDRDTGYHGAKGVLNGVGLSVLLWALIIATIYFGWHV